MARDYQANEDEMLIAKASSSSTTGTEIRKIFQEMQEAIVQLQAMRDYARDNGKIETEQHLNDVLQSFEAVKKRYGTAFMIKTGEGTTKAKAALREAKAGMRGRDNHDRAEIAEILSLLRTSHLQTVYENFSDFCSPRNKFEALVEKVSDFEKTQPAKNSPRFFSSQPESKKPALAVEAKVKPAKR